MLLVCVDVVADVVFPLLRMVSLAVCAGVVAPLAATAGVADVRGPAAAAAAAARLLVCSDARRELVGAVTAAVAAVVAPAAAAAAAPAAAPAAPAARGGGWVAGGGAGRPRWRRRRRRLGRPTGCGRPPRGGGVWRCWLGCSSGGGRPSCGRSSRPWRSP
ncbi:hypothetical protein I4F81_004700 [Pyropia yezoensis]|uniref:Uncharacterized protein n=1 Tax=Pyropia yezoensis TaxID=2788 RepID=A0ACC3BW30_PYRYE|nr:hypothetical protein I4F81_004700 [Neopyropia yezoensis]